VMATPPTAVIPAGQLGYVTVSIYQPRPSCPPVIVMTSAPCAHPDCDDVYVMPYGSPASDLGVCLMAAGWTDHPRLNGLVCPRHAYRHPIAALPPARIDHLDRPTAPFQAIPEEAL
jgi:hypothetical protein